MADMNEVGIVAKALLKFVDAMNEVGLNYNHIECISEINPSIKDHINIINSWRKKEVLIDEPKEIEMDPVEAVPEISEPIEKKDYTKITRNRLGGAKVVEISRLIADKYDGKKTDAVVQALMKNKRYPYTEKTIRHLVEQVTYSDLTNKYFTIVDGKIYKTFVPRESIFGNDPESAKKILEMLEAHDGDILSTITEEMSADDIIRLAIVRFKLFKKGRYTDIGSATKEILMMHIILENIGLNPTNIAEIMKSKYEIDCSVSEASAIKNGRSHKDLAKRLGVI